MNVEVVVIQMMKVALLEHVTKGMEMRCVILHSDHTGSFSSGCHVQHTAGASGDV